jgi:hypothetical protein
MLAINTKRQKKKKAVYQLNCCFVLFEKTGEPTGYTTKKPIQLKYINNYSNNKILEFFSNRRLT